MAEARRAAGAGPPAEESSPPHRGLVQGVSPPSPEAGRPMAEARRAAGAGPPADTRIPAEGTAALTETKTSATTTDHQHRGLAPGVSPPLPEAGRPMAEARRAVGAGPPVDAPWPQGPAVRRPAAAGQFRVGATALALCTLRAD
jgi:hypothetical protein